jgi:integrase
MGKKSSDGLTKVGPGKWLARITWHDAAGKKHDTDRVLRADTKLEALQKRRALQEELGGPDSGWTIEQALDKYIPLLAPGTQHSWGSYGRRLRDVFGPRKLASMRPDELQRWFVSLPVSDSTANNTRTLCASLFAWATSQGEFTGANPAKLTVARRTPRSAAQMLEEQENPPRRALLGDEVPRFLRALSEDLRPLLTVQLALGCRFGEVSSLELKDVNMATGEVRVRQTQYYGKVGVTKARRGRWSGVGPVVLEVLREHRARMEQERWPGWDRFVFPRPLTRGQKRAHDMWNYATVRLQIVQVQRELGIDVVSRTHSMRHTHITIAEVQRQLALDRSIGEAQAHRTMVGHSSPVMTATYTEQRALPHVALASRLEHMLVGGRVGLSAEKPCTIEE